MSTVVTDTHALLWYLLEPGKLSTAAKDEMIAAETGGTIYVPAVVLVELRYLVDKGKTPNVQLFGISNMSCRDIR